MRDGKCLYMTSSEEGLPLKKTKGKSVEWILIVTRVGSDSGLESEENVNDIICALSLH